MMRAYTAEGLWPHLLRDMRRTQDEIGRLFGGLRFDVRAEFPPVNIWVGPDGAIVTAEVPGITPDQIDITAHFNTVTVRGRRDPEPMEEEASVLRRERPYGAFSRTIVLPFRVDAEKVAARFERGVLRLDLPRPAADKPRHIKVEQDDGRI